MAQVNVLSLSNALSSAFRANLNSVLAALFSTNSGAAFPTTTAPGMLHVNTSGGTQTLWMTCLDFADFIRRVDRPGVLFYLDPPYWGCEDDYGRALFSRERFEDLAGLLRGLKGRFILSLNDLPEVRECFAGMQMAEVKTTYTIGVQNDARGERGELLISNWRLPLAAGGA